MINRDTIKLVPSRSPIVGRISKFGGSPNWIGDPQWPLSKASEKPMRFICQIRLDHDLIGCPHEAMAYMFMSDCHPDIDEWSQDKGEVAVIIQPGGILPDNLIIEDRTIGPSLYKITKGKRKFLFREKLKTPVEYKLELSRDREPDNLSEFDNSYRELGLDQDHLLVNKIGGNPSIQFDIPFETNLTWNEFSSRELGEWIFAMQIYQEDEFFQLEFSGATGYLFVSKDYKKGWLEFHC